MSSPLRWLALVMLDEAREPDFEAVREFIAANFEDAPAMAGGNKTDNMFVCTLGEFTAAATLVPNPVPWSQLEGPCATAWYWPTAADALRDHRAHLVVTLIDEGGKATEKSMALTQLVAGLASQAGVEGVFWGPGRIVHPPGAFIEQAVQSTSNDLPLFLWVDFRVERGQERNSRLYTTGMEALGFTELEAIDFPGEPQHLLEFCYNVAHYQLAEQKHLDDGDTIGLTDEVQVIARREGSMFDENLEIVRLDFQAPAT